MCPASIVRPPLDRGPRWVPRTSPQHDCGIKRACGSCGVSCSSVRPIAIFCCRPLALGVDERFSQQQPARAGRLPRSSSWPTRCGPSCWPKPPPRPCAAGAPAIPKAMASLFRPRVQDAWIWQVAIGDQFHPSPRQPMLLAPSPNGTEPALDQVVAERCDRRRTHWHGVVGKPPAQYFGEPLALRLDAAMASCPELLLDLPQLCPHPLSNRRPPQHEAAAAPPGRAVVREPEEVERLRFAEATRAAVCDCIPTELDVPRLVRV